MSEKYISLDNLKEYNRQMKETYIEPLESKVSDLVDDYTALTFNFQEGDSKLIALSNFDKTLLTKIDWGDGTIETNFETMIPEKYHTYAEAGEYVCKIYGTTPFRAPRVTTAAKFAKTITTIGDDTFNGCSRLTNVIMPNSITTIGQRAFSGCNGLTNVIIPDSVTSMGSQAFYNCSNLTKVEIGSGVSSGLSVFSNCNNITTLIFKSTTPWSSPRSSFYLDPIENIFVPYGCAQAYREEWLKDNYESYPISEEVLGRITELDREAMMSDLEAWSDDFIKLNPNEDGQTVTGYIEMRNSEAELYDLCVATLMADNLNFSNIEQSSSTQITADSIILDYSGNTTAELYSESISFWNSETEAYAAYSSTGVQTNYGEFVFPEKENGEVYTLATLDDIENEFLNFDSGFVKTEKEETQTITGGGVIFLDPYDDSYNVNCGPGGIYINSNNDLLYAEIFADSYSLYNDELGTSIAYKVNAIGTPKGNFLFPEKELMKDYTLATVEDIEEEISKIQESISLPEIEYYTLIDVTVEGNPEEDEVMTETLVNVELTFVDDMMARYMSNSKVVEPYAATGSSYAVVDVVPGDRYHIDNVMSYYQARCYIFTDAGNMPKGVYPTAADTKKTWYNDIDVTVPEGASKLYLSCAPTSRVVLQKYVLTSSGGSDNETESETIKKYVLDIDKLKDALGTTSIAPTPTPSTQVETGPVVLVKKDTSIQVRTQLRNIDGVMCVNMQTNGSNNNGFNFTNYTYGAKPADDDIIITGTSYKGASDDICPIKYNSSYIGGNHGMTFGIKLTAEAHGKTEADIGSTWLSENGKNYIIYAVPDANTILCLSEYTGNPSSPLVINPVITTPLTHVSGATNTGDISFTKNSWNQICPAISHKSLTFRSSEGKVLEADGVLYGQKYIDVIDSYEIIDVVQMINALVDNVGNNTNASYYAESLPTEVLYETVYRFFESGCCLVISNLIPLRSGIGMQIFGGTQAQMIGNTAYVPYTTFDTLTTIESSGITLTPNTWKDAEFPPYKFYEFNADGDKAFGLGYCLYGQTSADARVDTAGRAGWFDGSTKKMYPCIIHGSTTEVYGKGITSYSWRTPIIKDENGVMMTWYKIENDTFVEMEFFNDFSGKITMPQHLAGCRMEVVKKTDSVNILGDIVGPSGINAIVNASGSATIKCH